jgi:predicted DCC family thiol-disulfide oxidoreductase YuxK
MGLLRTFVVGNLLALGTFQLVDMLRPEDKSVESWLLFDGVCNLCDGFVNFVADHDALRRVKFGTQQKHMAILERIGAPTDLSTLVLVQGDAFHTHSAAALRTMALLDWPWAALSVGILVPSPIRDLVYRLVARHRYSIFGKADQCRVPAGDFRTRFIDYNPDEEGPHDPISGVGK